MPDLGSSKSALNSFGNIMAQTGDVLTSLTPGGASMVQTRVKQEEAAKIAEQEARIASATKQLELVQSALSNPEFLATAAPEEIISIKGLGAKSLQQLGQDPSLVNTFTADQKLVPSTVTDRYGNERTILVQEGEGVVTGQKSGEKLLTSAEMAQKLSLQRAGASNSGSEFERTLSWGLSSGNITPDEAIELRKKRLATQAGTEGKVGVNRFSLQETSQGLGNYNSATGDLNLKPFEGLQSGTQARHEDTRNAQKQEYNLKQTNLVRGEYEDASQHASNIERTVDDALAAIDSGNSGVADNMLSQVMSQVVDTDVRAFQMYKTFDQSYGDVLTRMYSAVSRYISGNRSESDTAAIKEVLINYKTDHAIPTKRKIKNRYRAFATEGGLDPFSVVMPESPEDIRDAPGITKEQKLKALKTYFPGDFGG